MSCLSAPKPVVGLARRKRFLKGQAAFRSEAMAEAERAIDRALASKKLRLAPDAACGANQLMVESSSARTVIAVESIRRKSSTPRKIVEIASIFAVIIVVEFWAGDETVIWVARSLYRWVVGLPPPPQ